MRDKPNSRYIIFIILFTLPLILSAFSPAEQIRGLRPGEAEIWYLGHCGYAVKTQNHLLIFDYIELEENPSERGLDKGFIDPVEIGGLNVGVFVTHSHVDHYDKIIHGWGNTVENIRYFFGWKLEGELEGAHHYLEGPRETLMLDDMEIHTVNSSHSGVPEVAYLVKVDGLVIYHGGDYQGRSGRNGPSHLKEDMVYLKGVTDAVDLFFIGAWAGAPYLESIRSLRPKIMFPMHYRKEEHKYKEFASELKGLGIETPVYCPEKRGDRFFFENGTVRDK
jgi:L-ascorbate metabolism protein UlaG (beta-lactamase superfamily)